MSERRVHVRDSLVLEPTTGVIDYVDGGQVLLGQATAGVVYVDAKGRTKTLELAGQSVSHGLAADRASLGVANDEVQITWQLSAGSEVSLCLEVENKGSQTIRIVELRVLDVASKRGGSLGWSSKPRSWRFYQNGWQSWSPTFARRIADGIWIDPNNDDFRAKHQPHVLPKAHRVLSSEWFTVLVPDARRVKDRKSPDQALLLGFVSTAEQLSEVRIAFSDALDFRSLRAVCYADGVPLAPGAKLSSETLLLATGPDPLALLELYAARAARAMHARTPTEPLTGWCTWYHFFGEETADDVMANLERIAEERLPLKAIVIDDGYQTSIGDWLDVDTTKYPQGMKDTAERIVAAGHRPGIWTAPFGVSASSRLYAEHEDWILRNEQGEPVLAWQHWGQDICALDLSLPAVHTWLQQVFHTLSDDWGFEFFKIDFLFAGGLNGVRSGPRTTRAQALRHGLQTIRAAIGDKFLLGCGAPLGPSIGIVDAMRIGPDVHVDWEPFWRDLSAPSAANAILNSMTRSFMHGRLWLNDPDCILLRRRGNDSNLVLNEMRTLTTIAGLMGGLMVDSDNLPSIRSGRLEYLRRVLPPYGQCAVPVDLFEHERPSTLVLPVETSWGSWVLAAVLNWKDHCCVTTLRLSDLGLAEGDYHAYDYWRQRYLGVVRDELIVDSHQPHQTVLLLFKAVCEKPQLLTSTFHMHQGAVEIKDARLLGNRFIVQLQKPGRQFGYLLFAVPQESQYRVGTVRVNGRPQRPVEISPGIWRAGFTLSDRATVELALG